MHKHHETSDDVFVDREEHIEWMNDALAKSLSNLDAMKGVEKNHMEWEEKYITFEEIP